MCWFHFWIAPLLSSVPSFDFVVRKDRTLQESQQNVNAVQRELYYTKEGVLMGGKAPKWQN